MSSSARRRAARPHRCLASRSSVRAVDPAAVATPAERLMPFSIPSAPRGAALHSTRRSKPPPMLDRLTNRASAAGDCPPATRHLHYLRSTLKPPNDRAASARPLQALVRRPGPEIELDALPRKDGETSCERKRQRANPAQVEPRPAVRPTFPNVGVARQPHWKRLPPPDRFFMRPLPPVARIIHRSAWRLGLDLSADHHPLLDHSPQALAGLVATIDSSSVISALSSEARRP